MALRAELVTQLWLVTPAESIVESMARVAKDVFDTHRRLGHRKAAKELTTRWNCPGLTAADSLIRAVNSKNKFNFKRTRSSLAAAFEGTVIARHRPKVQSPPAATSEGIARCPPPTPVGTLSIQL